MVASWINLYEPNLIFSSRGTKHLSLREKKSVDSDIIVQDGVSYVYNMHVKCLFYIGNIIFQYLLHPFQHLFLQWCIIY